MECQTILCQRKYIVISKEFHGVRLERSNNQS